MFYGVLNLLRLLGMPGKCPEAQQRLEKRMRSRTSSSSRVLGVPHERVKATAVVFDARRVQQSISSLLFTHE